VLQCVLETCVGCCDVLQCIAMCCSVLQCVLETRVGSCLITINLTFFPSTPSNLTIGMGGYLLCPSEGSSIIKMHTRVCLCLCVSS